MGSSSASRRIALATFSSSPFDFGVIGEAHHRLREADLGHVRRHLAVEQEVAGLHLLQLGDGADVPGAELLSRDVLLALLEQERPHPLLRVRARVDERLVGPDRALEDAEEVDPPGEGVGDRLEDERGGVGALDVRDRAGLRGRGHALDDQVEQRVRAEVLRRDPAGDGEDLAPSDRVLERVRHLLDSELAALEVLLHQRLVGLDDLVEQLLAVLLHELGHLVRDRAGLALLAAAGARVGAHVQDVDDPRQLVLGPDRQVHGDAALRELLLQLAERAEEVGALAVEHVDEEHTGDPELLGPPPDPRRADLDAHHAAQDDERALDDAERAASLALEARVARDVDQVELPLLPVGVRERERDRHHAPLLVVVPVGDGRPLFDRAEPVRLPRLEQQRLDERRLAGAAVADDGDVADLPGLDGRHRGVTPPRRGCAGNPNRPPAPCRRPQENSAMSLR